MGATIEQYVDKDDVHGRWIADVMHGNDQFKTYHLPTQEAAIQRCVDIANMLGWDIDDFSTL